MKRLLSILLLFAILVCATGCNGGDVGGTIYEIPKILSPMEYTLYLNIFYNGEAASYTDNEYTKEGVFGILRDSYNNKDRYYVWGYSDETMCCDWQWEFVPDDPESLPKPGSHVKVKGVLKESGSALDGYWLEDASVEVLREYVGGSGDLDMLTVSPTLTRVQLIFICNRAEQFSGSLVRIYGRVMSGNRIQHPYYDGAWYLDVDYDAELPPIGTWVTVTGDFVGTSVNDCRISAIIVEPD